MQTISTAALRSFVRCFHLALCLAVASLSALPAEGIPTAERPASGPSSAGDELLELVLRSEAERRGDYDELAASWLAALPRLADDFRVELLFRRLAAITERMKDPGALVAPLEDALGGELLGADASELARQLLSTVYRRSGNRDEHARLLEESGLLRSFLVIGPFGKLEIGSLRRSYPPEEEIDLSRTYRDAWQELRWRHVPFEPHERQVTPAAHVHPSQGVVYLLAQVRAAEELPAELHFESRGAARIWVNRDLVQDDAGSRTILPRRRSSTVLLRKGWNRILVKTESRFALRLVDERGFPFPEELLEDEREGTLREEPRLEPGRSSPVEPPPEGRVETAADRWKALLDERSEKRPERGDGEDAPGGNAATDGAEDDADDAEAGTGRAAGTDRRSLALARIGLSVLRRHEGRSDLAVEAAERALELASDDPFVLHQAAVTFSDASYLPSNLAKNRARDAWRKVTGADPDFLPAYVHLARYALADEQAVEAARTLRKALDRRGDFLYGLYELHRVYDRKEWHADARRVLETIERVTPNSALPPLREAELYRSRGNLERAVDRYRDAWERDRRLTYILSIVARLEIERGQLDAAEEALRESLSLEPDRFSVRSQLADLLAGRGRHEEAIELLREELDRPPPNPRVHRELAALLDRADRPAEARKHYEKAVALAPGDLDLRRFLAHRSESEDRFWEPYDEDLEDWVSRVPEEGPLVDRAEAVLVLDLSVLRVHEDGSSSEYVHQAFKLLSEEGKEELARVATPGELLSLRTVLPDGEVLEPVAALGQESFVMPGLKPGVFTEYAYLARNESRGGRRVQHGPFYFQDFRHQHSFLLSRWVLILPPALESGIAERHLRPRLPDTGLVKVEKTERELEDGTRVITYESRNAGRIEPERFMPRYTEYVPNVEVLPRRDWADVAEALRERTLHEATFTPELRRAALEATDGIDDPLEKARALYRFVNERVPDGDGSSSALRTLLEKSGDRTVLFKTLLDLAGVPSRWAFLRPAEDMLPRTDWSFPSPAMFPYRHVLVELSPSDPLWLDLRYRQAPFGWLAEYVSGGTAFIISPGGYEIRRVGSVPPGEHARVTDVTYRLGEGLEAEVDVELALLESRGYAQKESIRTSTAFRKNLAGRYLASQMFPGAVVEKVDFPGIGAREEPLRLTFELRDPRALRPRDGGFALPVVVQPARMVKSFGGPPRRKHPYHLSSPVVYRNRSTVHPGPGYRLRKLPDDVALANPLGLYSLRFERDGGAVVVERRLTLEPGRLEPAEFPVFLEFCEAIDAAEREELVFRRADL